MPIQPNFLERAAFFSLNAAPAPMLDLGGALAFQTISTAVHLNIFSALGKRPSSAAELAQTLNLQERGALHLLEALETIGYVTEKNGRYQNSSMTKKWLLEDSLMDMAAAMACWDAFLRELWPHAPAVVQSGQRPFNFYEFTASTPGLSHAHQRMMQSNANLVGADIVKKTGLPSAAVRLLDVGGGHGQFTIHFCQGHPQLRATIMDSAIALETARQNIEAAHLSDQVDLYAADLWQTEWGNDWDCVLLFNLLHHWDLDTNRELLCKAYEALKPGGKVAIFDQVSGKQFGSASSAIIKLVGLMFYIFADGRVFSQEELTGILQDANFRKIQFYPLREAPGSSLLVAEK